MARVPLRFPSPPEGLPWRRIALYGAVAAACLFLGGAAGIFLLAKFGDFPSIDSAAAYRPSVSSKIYDRNNRVVGEIFLERRTVVPFETIPKHVVNAFVAAEDGNFYRHKGVDYLAIARAVVKDVLHLSYAQGASTITQQAVRNLFLTQEKSLRRKAKELILAWRIEKSHTKDEILYLYLNQIYLGEGAYGVEAAARTWFGKGVSELDLAEGAMLAGLAQAPNRYNPRTKFDLAKGRQKYVLRRLVEEGLVAEAEAEAALARKVAVAPPSTFRSKAAYFLEHVRYYLQEKYGADALYKDQLEIYTTIDGRLQEAATDALTSWVAELEGRWKRTGLEGAVVAVDPRTGGVLAMVGGVDFARSQFNRAIQARRQPGSAFKPFVYAAALDKGRTVVSSVDDSPVEFEGANEGKWKPRNYDGSFLGPVTLLEAISQSRNLATVRLLSEIGVDGAIGMARAAGIQSPIERNLSIGLGTASVSPLEMANAYATFAALGDRTTPYFIREVRDGSGKVLERAEPQVERTIAPETAYLTTRLLQEVIRSGTAESAKGLSPNIAGKTGTTNDAADAWFVGYSPDIAAAVWVGYDQPAPLGSHVSAAQVALPVWSRFMGRALGVVGNREFPVPAGIAFANVDLGQGKVLPQGEGGGTLLPFRLGTLPEPGASILPSGGTPRQVPADDLL